MMTYPKAITIAKKALEQEIKKLAPNANLHDIYGADAPACVEASRRRGELKEALKALGQRTF
jgi:hypothetical protein